MDTNPNRRQFLQAATLSAAPALAAQPGPRKISIDPAREWRQYGGNAEATRYSPLNQITPSNVKRLKPAWVHHTEDAMERPATTIESEPVVVDGVMYIQTAQLQVRALDAATGKTIWNFDPLAGGRRRSAGISRGVTFWQDPGDPKITRIFAPYRDRLFSLDARTGKLAPAFAEEGVLDLRKNFDPDRADPPFSMGHPPTAYKDLIICGGGGGDSPEPGAAGHIRGFDARTGKRRWIFHTVPKPGEFGHDTWGGDSWKRAGGTNNWGGMSVDHKRGLVFISTGSPSFDYYGGDRKGSNLFGNCVLALKGESGERVWHFQTTHHDVWDYDLPCQPCLVTIRQGGRRIDAVVQMSKMGFVFVFDRATGKPLFPIEERPVPPSDIPGEVLSRTQPFPVKPPPISRQGFSEQDVAAITPEKHAYLLERFLKLRAGGIYTPPSTQGTLILPGFNGGANWGGASVDPENGLLFVNSNENVYWMTLKKADTGVAYTWDFQGYVQLLDDEGYPSVKPPWGWMTAIDLNTGEFRWRNSFGEHPELTARGIPPTGTTN